ncbi:MAG: arginine--tRNA ligase, partial [Mariprofundaceae bacterium]
MKQALEQAVTRAVEELIGEHAHAPHLAVRLSRPKTREHGDYTTNAAMPLAGVLKRNPHDIAQDIIARAEWPAAVQKVEIAGPGFINIWLAEAAEAEVLRRIVAEGGNYGRIEPGADAPRVNLEFVSANPTGPMHVGHGRGAVLGDTLANLLAARGMHVEREYYINDAGAQIGVLADSVWLRMRELEGEAIDFPESAYPGEYVIEIARALLAERPMEAWRAMDDAARRETIGRAAVDANMAMIRDDLEALGIRFDRFFSERALHASGRVQALIERLREMGVVYRGVLPPPKGKAVEDYEPVEQWLFRTTDFGDDVDRPLMKQDGSPTYFAADIAYHMAKHARGYDRMTDVWGADHGGYIKRVQAALKALTGRDGQPDV